MKNIPQAPEDSINLSEEEQRKIVSDSIRLCFYNQIAQSFGEDTLGKHGLTKDNINMKNYLEMAEIELARLEEAKSNKK